MLANQNLHIFYSTCELQISGRKLWFLLIVITTTCWCFCLAALRLAHGLFLCRRFLIAVKESSYFRWIIKLLCGCSELLFSFAPTSIKNAASCSKNHLLLMFSRERGSNFNNMWPFNYESAWEILIGASPVQKGFLRMRMKTFIRTQS